MKLFVLFLNLAAAMRTASAFQVQPQPSSTPTSLMSSFHTTSDPNELGEDRRKEDILKALGNMEGPSMNYGHFARLEGKTELDIKGYDNFDAFKAAIDQVDCTKLLRGIGMYIYLYINYIPLLVKSVYNNGSYRILKNELLVYPEK
mmetsp:Transcript_24170/g.27018  ORF Transcript_24170/g.27018 Transcript_24170/m.27018 type:complete len:146 (+) Transcript_24170:105-542(+)